MARGTKVSTAAALVISDGLRDFMNRTKCEFQRDAGAKLGMHQSQISALILRKRHYLQRFTYDKLVRNGVIKPIESMEYKWDKKKDETTFSGHTTGLITKIGDLSADDKYAVERFVDHLLQGNGTQDELIRLREKEARLRELLVS